MQSNPTSLVSPTLASKVSLHITSNEIKFTKAEVGFIQKNLHRKYPAPMGDFINHARELMRVLQIASMTRLTYIAQRYTPEGSQRYHVSEMLAGLESGQRFMVAIQPVEPEQRRQLKDHQADEDGGLGAVLAELRASGDTHAELLNTHKTCNGIAMGLVLYSVLSFLETVRQETLVQNFQLVLDDTPSLTLDLSHRASTSHYLRINVDFI